MDVKSKWRGKYKKGKYKEKIYLLANAKIYVRLIKVFVYSKTHNLIVKNALQSITHSLNSGIVILCNQPTIAVEEVIGDVVIVRGSGEV